MKVLVFSDSHGYNMSMAYAIEREKPDAVLHLGDHTDDADDIRRAFPALTIYHVRGNNDFDMDVPLFAVVTVGGVRMYLTHGHRARIHAAQRSCARREEGCSFAFFGHTHRMMAEREQGVFVCNPGSISLPRAFRRAMRALDIGRAAWSARSSWSMRTARCCGKRVL